MVEVVSTESSTTSFTRRQHLAKTFDSYRAELDSYNERRERLIILSRSITQLSKKLIFHLHRGATSASPVSKAKLIKEGRTKEREIHKLFLEVKKALDGAEDSKEAESFWKYNKQVTPGLEEYIEGLSFLYYLEHQSLISLEQVQRTLSAESGESLVVVTPEDFILGISDLTGELMRYATNALSTGDHETPLEVCDFVRTLKSRFDSLPSSMAYKMKKKQEETARSLEKIEKVCYALRLRLIEYADRPDILAQMAKRALDDVDGKDDGRERDE